MNNILSSLLEMHSHFAMAGFHAWLSDDSTPLRLIYYVETMLCFIWVPAIGMNGICLVMKHTCSE